MNVSGPSVKVLRARTITFALRGPGIRFSPHAFNTDEELRLVLSATPPPGSRDDSRRATQEASEKVKVASRSWGAMLTHEPRGTIREVRMVRFALSLGFAVYVALAAGAAPSLKGRACSQRCPDDDSDGNCAPDCADCACCPHLRLMVVSSEAKLAVPPGSSKVPERTVAIPLSPEPAEILHVPIMLLA